MRIGICDDCKQDREEAEQILKNSEELQREDFQILCITPEDLTVDLEEELFFFDLVIMDIEFEGESYNGISLTKKINEAAPLCQIIYLTDFLEFAPNVYETEHCYFVLKKNMGKMLPLAVEKASRLYKEEKKSSFLELVSDGKKHYLQVHDILCVEKENRQLHVYTIQGDYFSYQSLSAVARKCNREMVRCHGSFMVNLHYVSHYEREKMTLVNGMSIPIGRTYQEQTKTAYLNYWVDRI